MQEANDDLGVTSQVKADAQGVPGQRRFRLLVEAQGGSACLWLEKEQLLQLGGAIKRLIAEMSEGEPSPSQEASSFLGAAEASGRTWEMKVNTLTLGHDHARNLFLLAAQGLDVEDKESPEVRFWVEGRQLDTLADEAFEVCAAGRPLCPLCSAPLNPGETHVCSRSNGHHDSVEFE